MTDDRIAVMRAVLEGKLSADYVTWDEIREVEEIVMNLIIDERVQNNPAVFSGMDNYIVH